MSDSRNFSDAADQVIRDYYPQFITIHVIIDKISALGGFSPSADQVNARALHLHIQRPPGFRKWVQQQIPQYPRDVEAVQRIRKLAGPLKPPTRREIASFETIERWAQQNDIQFRGWDDLSAVNDAAEEMMHPGFARELPVHRMARLWPDLVSV